MTEPLVCPSCATTHGLDERFCSACGMPLIYSGRSGMDEPVTEAPGWDDWMALPGIEWLLRRFADLFD